MQQQRRFVLRVIHVPRALQGVTRTQAPALAGPESAPLDAAASAVLLKGPRRETQASRQDSWQP